VSAQTPARRSPIDAWHRTATTGAFLKESMPLPVQLLGHVPAGDRVVLTERSWRRRFGVKGPAGESWLAARGFHVPAPANSWAVADGVLVGRLATSEFLVEAIDGSQPRVASVAQELAASDRPTGVYPVVRQDLVLTLEGPALNDLLRQVCSVDFAPLLQAARASEGALLLTSMIGAGVVAVPRLEASTCRLTLWVDPSFAHYFWTTLMTVAADLGGGVRLEQSTGP
jgi:sarcosine oxidase, subunit gamma